MLWHTDVARSGCMSRDRETENKNSNITLAHSVEIKAEEIVSAHANTQVYCPKDAIIENKTRE